MEREGESRESVLSAHLYNNNLFSVIYSPTFLAFHNELLTPSVMSKSHILEYKKTIQILLKKKCKYFYRNSFMILKSPPVHYPCQQIIESCPGGLFLIKILTFSF